MRSSPRGYYDEKLSAERLWRCYDIAPPRVRQYLQAEIDFVRSFVTPESLVLELGCGYGRALQPISGRAKGICGIDTSLASLIMARSFLKGCPDVDIQLMDAVQLGFKNRSFDLVFCIQNGISAFKVNRLELIKEAVRVIRPGGRALLSSYSDKFWQSRLEWFELQADEGLLGEIDYDKTGDGVISCKDGFRAVAVSPSEFLDLAGSLGLKAELHEIDSSSLFCEIHID